MLHITKSARTNKRTFAEAIAKGASKSDSLNSSESETQTYSLKKMIRTRHRPVRIFF